jgi:hypothetical protein
MDSDPSMVDAALPGRILSDHFSGSIKYSGQIDSWEPLGGTLIDYSQANALLDASREILAVEFPRRKFDTHRQITVGGLKAFTGTYWTGSERYLGIAKLNELASKHKLGFVEGGHLMSRKLGRVEGGAEFAESLSVSVRVEFTRPSQPAGAWIDQQTRGAGWEAHQPRLIDATWQVFCELLDKAPVERAHGYWNSGRVDIPDGEIRIGNLIFLPPHVIASFGGPDGASQELGAIDRHVVSGDADNNGLALRLWRRSDEGAPERMQEVGRLLHRHGMPLMRSE